MSADWEAVADEVLAVIEARMEPQIRKASEHLYNDLLSTVQDYLKDNAVFNIKSALDSAWHERSSLRTENEALKALLRGAADTCWKWARESQSGGWSTHQVDANRALARTINEVVNCTHDWAMVDGSHRRVCNKCGGRES